MSLATAETVPPPDPRPASSLSGRPGKRAQLSCDGCVAPGLPVGTITIGTGPIMAGGGTFDVTFTGTGGHGGQGAHLTPDLMVAQATYVMALQTIVSRSVAALETAVVSVGYVNGGRPDAPDGMPPQPSLGGPARRFSTTTPDPGGRRLPPPPDPIA